MVVLHPLTAQSNTNQKTSNHIETLHIEHRTNPSIPLNASLQNPPTQAHPSPSVRAHAPSTSKPIPLPSAPPGGAQGHLVGAKGVLGATNWAVPIDRRPSSLGGADVASVMFGRRPRLGTFGAGGLHVVL